MSGRIVDWLASTPRTLRELGAFNAVLYWIDRAANACTGGRVRVRRYLFVVQPLNRDPQRVGRSVADGGFSVRLLAQDDPVRAQFPVPAAVIQRRIEQGSTCLVAELNGQFAAYLWMHAGPYPEDEVRCLFEPWPSDRVAWDFDVYVAPRLRATRTFARLWQAATRHLLAAGFTHSASRISTYNVASLRSHVRSGAVVSGSAVFITLGRWQLAIAPGGRPGAVSFTRSAQPRLRISLPATGS